MSRNRRDSEVARVATELDALLDDLRANVGALSEILTRPDGGETDGMVAS